MSTKQPNIWFITGEESGDEFAAEIALICQKNIPNIIISGMGGNYMKKANIKLIEDSTELGVFGLIEVLKKLPTFKKILKKITTEALQQKPDIIILVDYTGFNLRLAQNLKNSGIPIFYFICPKVWVRGAKRIPIIAQHITKLFTIFPFEKKLFADFPKLLVQFVGHPLIPLMKKIPPPIERQTNLIALLPGSRFSEINRLIIPILETAKKLKKQNPQLEFIIPISRPSIEQMITLKVQQVAPELNISIKCGETIKWLFTAQAALACSGTVTLQALIAGLPLVSIYRVHPITYHLMKNAIKTKYFTLANIIANKEIFQEFLQHQITIDNLVSAMQAILPTGQRYQQVQQDILEVMNLLQTNHNTFEEIAQAIEQQLNN